MVSLPLYEDGAVVTPGDGERSDRGNDDRSPHGLGIRNGTEAPPAPALRFKWRIRPFRGMVNDLRRRAPYYWSDWTDALDYRVVPATVYMYFAKFVLHIRLLSLLLFLRPHRPGARLSSPGSLHLTSRFGQYTQLLAQFYLWLRKLT